MKPNAASLRRASPAAVRQHPVPEATAGGDSRSVSESTIRRLLEESLLMQEELRLLSRRLLSVQEEERKRISHKLHDVVAQTLNGINLRLSALNARTTATTNVIHKKIASAQRLLEKSITIVHRFAWDLRPAVLDDLGLIPALQSYIKSLTERTGLRVNFTAFAGVEKQDITVRTMLYRVVQEALTNVIRHAKAGRVHVRIASHGGALRMEIKDNGQGFKVESAALARSSKRLGLLDMRERVEMIGGNFHVDSVPGKATTVRAEIPPPQTSTRKRPAPKSL